MTRLALLAALCGLAACGVDGEPKAAPAPTVNGGVTISNSGIYPHANIGLGGGPVSVNIGLGRWGWGGW